MRVAVVQFSVVAGDPDANRRLVKERVAALAAGATKPDVVVLPELWSTGYALERARELASPEGNAEAAFLGSLAVKYNLAFAGGSVLARVGDTVRNRAQVIDASGRLIALYDKIHLFRLMDEDKYLAAGNRRSAFVLNGVPCAAVICYDIRFCELVRASALDGARVLFVSAEWPLVRKEHWCALLRARAIENQFFVVACNRCGVTGAETFGGNSMIIAPDGSVLAQADEHDAVLTADLDFTLLERVRAACPVYTDRVPETYC
ncbi:MAG TPA: carbon-nitrogen family hydrolase [Candidatus Avidesulfovibrio excrementigallinarum]|nr:carbon-nitrogen family hydrolase [Candidatus Avidesulfovibrio excrementigallinarum]